MLKVELAAAGNTFSSWELAVPEIAGMGFRGIELDDAKKLLNPSGLARLLGGFLMRVACFDFVRPVGADVDAILHGLQMTGANRVTLRAEAHADAASLEQAVKALAEKALPLGLHPSACTAALGLEGTAKFCEAVDEDTCGLVADSGRLVRAGLDGKEFVKSFSARVDYVRLADLSAEGNPVALGAGCTDLEGFVKVLHAVNYFGWLTVAGPDFESLKTSREFFREKLGVYSRL